MFQGHPGGVLWDSAVLKFMCPKFCTGLGADVPQGYPAQKLATLGGAGEGFRGLRTIGSTSKSFIQKL